MKIEEIVERTQHLFSHRRVFGEPVRHDGVTVIPVAYVAGGGGGGMDRGSGTDDGGLDDDQERTGGGFGLRARPAGVYVIDADGVRWRPAWDGNRLVSTLAGVLVVFLISRWRVAAIRARTPRRSRS